jgi:hypothetical protein
MFLWVVTNSVLYAQTTQKSCGYIFDINLIKQYNLNRYQQVLNINNQLALYKQSLQNKRLLSPDKIITIPVVIHVLHFGEAIGTGRNISEAQILSQIDVLNEDFRRLNGDKMNTPTAFQSVGGDFGFQFKLACVDPNGVTTTGITRTKAGVERFSPFRGADGSTDEISARIKFTNLGGKDAWPTNNYLNIWVCDMSPWIGYALSPDLYATKSNTDGVVIKFDVFGRSGNLQARFNKGRTTTHEVGHYLNLRHIWGNANCGDDEVGDTPTQQAANSMCPPFPNRTCGNATNGDMFMNYMDYTDDACQNIFTNGQKERARALFFMDGVRSRFFYRVDGAATLCQNETSVFTTPNALCLPVTWSVTGNAVIQSGQNTNSISVVGTAAGTATVTMTAGTYTDSKQISIINNVIAGNYYGATSGILNTNNTVQLGSTNVKVSLPNATSFTWTHTSGNAVWSANATGSSMDFSLTASNSAVTFNVKAKNSCGNEISRNISFSTNSWSFRAAPNPATSTLRISGTQITQPTARVAETPLKFEMRLYDKYGQIVKYAKNVTGVTDLDIDVSGLKPDIYQLQIFKDKELTNQRIEIRR